MGRKHKNLILEKIKIEGIADKGKAVGRYDGAVVFVEGAVPGDVVDVQVKKKRKNYYEGVVAVFHEYSEHRAVPFCSHFGICGGCRWQHLAYDEQLQHKEAGVRTVLERIGKVAIPEFLPIVGATATQYYRNKLEFTFSNRRWLTEEEVQRAETFEHRNALGFHKPGAFDKILDIEHCYLQPDPSNPIRNAVKAFALEHDFSFYDILNRTGFLRGLLLRTSSLGESMVVVIFAYEDEAKRLQLLDFLAQKFPEITALQWIINEKSNDFFLDLDVYLYAGRDFIYEKLGHIKYKIGAKSFFQTNTEQALRLYEIVADFAELKGTENVYDLYTGTGSIALFLAHRCEQVVGVEEVAAAIEDANLNARNNGVGNVTFYCGDVKDVVTPDFAARHGKPDLVVTDPPRAGMHPKVIDILLELEAPRIVYVSCNPATQARDVALLSEKYQILKLQPVDMFPHTHHIESVALLEKIKRMD